MDFRLTEEQRMWRGSVRRFACDKLFQAAFIHDEAQTFAVELLPEMKELGYWGAFVPLEYGGAGGDNFLWVLMMEEVGRVDGGMGIALLSHANCVRSIMIMGSEEQKRKYLPGLSGKGGVAGFALTEPDAGSDAAAIVSTAVRRGDKYILNGSKAFVTNAGIADVYIVFAKTDVKTGAGGISAFIVDADAPGLSIGSMENKLGVRTCATGEVILDDCEVPAEDLLGRENYGWKDLMEMFAVQRLGIAAIAVGTAQGALDWALSYTTERPAFGKMVSGFQGVQWMLADMKTQIEAARMLTYRGADLADRRMPHRQEAAMAKVFASEMCMRVTTDTVQLFGAHGYCKSFPVERYFRDAKMYAVGGGTTQILRTLIARDMIKEVQDRK